MAKSWEPRFWCKVLKRDENACWPWVGATSCGYGRFKLQGKNYGAHQLSWWLNSGAERLPEVVMHTCDSPSCVNPRHLVAGTLKTNHADMVSKGRQHVMEGSQIHTCKLTELDVLEIRRLLLDGHSLRGVAATYGLSHKTVLAIKQRTTWKHLP